MTQVAKIRFVEGFTSSVLIFDIKLLKTLGGGALIFTSLL